MRRRTRLLATMTAAGALTLGVVTPAQASPPDGDQIPSALGLSATSKPNEVNRDNLPLTPEQQELRNNRMAAMDAVVNGEATVQQRGESRGVLLPNGTWVQWGTPKTEKIWTLLVQFGDQISEHGGTAGPRAGQLPEPDRSVDNSTAWSSEYQNRSYYQNMLFSKKGPSMTDFYLKQSSGRYTVDGTVENWVTLPYNESRYGYNPPPGQSDADSYGTFVNDSMSAWYNAQVAAGKTPAQIKDYLKQFDIWDRYDYDADGNFDEPDGYIDHVQLIHAGEGEEAGGGAQGDDAIWSHSWFSQGGGSGPSWNPLGGSPIGDTGLWAGDYTTEPENGGLGVFAHEYGHDLGLPDLYERRSGTNGTGYWTLMSSGSWLNMGGNATGDIPGYMGPWEKLFLGWLDYDKVELNEKFSASLLGAAGGTSVFKEATLVNLPSVDTVHEYTKPASGSYEWFGGEGDQINASLAREIDLTNATTASMSAKVRLDTEQDYDYFFAQASVDNGGSWTQLGDKLSGDNGGFQNVTWDLSAYKGKKIKVRYRYTSDQNTHGTGVFLDDYAVTVNGSVAFTDGAENGDNGWTAYNWKRTTGTETEKKARYYLVENRRYVGYDKTLQVGPYQRGWADTKYEWVNRYPYQDGALIWYVDTTFADNDVSRHNGHGWVLPIDARPDALKWSDGTLIGNAQQSFDATFGNAKTDKITWYKNGVPTVIKPSNGVNVFDDSDVNRYWRADNPLHSTKVAGEGVKIRILLDGSANSPMLITVTRSH
ncbi:protease [Actinorhabdospora filicis]|uniref:Protease n=1 Tax=Actinorhabdospora filicis TaxID=1785913 RepID=A0A9W6SPK9_9ACTN|nr:immune inhibitor A domain-containing protein [Actinorhabdospora filicis]GLZ79782.1 protease [Actinorhabdospora filicis]